MNFLAQIHVMPLTDLLDPQGKAVMGSLSQLGLSGINDVRIGKNINLKISATNEQEAEEICKTACEKLLHNPVMEQFTFELSEIK
ncbi:MAG: phosphoribosylformylglycinamidine synthase subunit PurS [Chitinophagaceae bacterium]|nr:phosphoribosylformylglycinamidine synthase subunit PurS [Chitinophagaceae bacterium]